MNNNSNNNIDEQNVVPSVTNSNNQTQTVIPVANNNQTQASLPNPNNGQTVPVTGQQPSSNGAKNQNNDSVKTVNKMIRFNYKLKDPFGKMIQGYFDAESKVDVQAFLTNNNKDCEIISIEEDKLSTNLGFATSSTNKKIPSKELNFFLTQLSTYVKSGIPLVESMEILSRQAKSKNTQILYKKIVFELNRGVSFSTCLEKQGKKFPKMLINMIKTSEMTGDLTGVLDDMAAYYKREDSNRKQIINAMTYPSVLMIFALAVLTFVITYVVPSFTSMYSSAGADLPGITVAIIGISDFITGNWYYIIIVIGLIVATMVFTYKSSLSFRYFMQSFAMHVPVIKNLIKYNQLVTFTSTFSTLIKHDVFITDSMDILSKITDNEIYKRIIDDAITNLGKGNGISVAFKGNWAFPETAYEMLLTGEKTGKLGEMMEHVSAYYSEEQTNMITRLKSLIEPIMIVMLAVLVGIILIAVVVPMFDIYSTIV